MTDEELDQWAYENGEPERVEGSMNTILIDSIVADVCELTGIDEESEAALILRDKLEIRLSAYERDIRAEMRDDALDAIRRIG